MPPKEYPNGHTVGFEYETECITSDSIPGSIRALGISTAHDASIESEFSTVNGIRTCGKNLLRTVDARNTGIVGVELVSVPYNLHTTNVVPIIDTLTKWLTEAGESPQSNRAGIHFHIGLKADIETVKRILKLGRHLEALFFRLGGNGYRFRGEENAAAFCRPITKNGPPCVPFKDGYAKCFDVDQLENCETLSDFWRAYGNSDPESVPRYVAQRYTWLNFYSLLAHKTIEIRVFNKTLNALNIISEIDLWHKFVNVCISDKKLPNEEISVYDCPSDRVLNGQLDYIEKSWNVNPRTMGILRNIVKLTPPVRLSPSPMLTHLVDTQNVGNPWAMTKFTPVIVKDVERANVVTIHTIRRSGSARISRGISYNSEAFARFAEVVPSITTEVRERR